MLRDRVESEGPSGTRHGLSLLLSRHVAGSRGASWEAFGLAHNPEVEGSNPSPATKLDQHVRRFTSFAKGQPDVVVVSHLSVEARTSVRAFRLGSNRRGSGWPRRRRPGRPCRE